VVDIESSWADGGDAELCARWCEFQRVMHTVQRKKLRAPFGRAKKRAYDPRIMGCSKYRSSTGPVRTFRSRQGGATPATTRR
jgi:hypothetical protein